MKLTNWITDDYLEALKTNSIKVSQDTETRVSPLYLRHILLEGNIYYELKENGNYSGVAKKLWTFDIDLIYNHRQKG